MNINMPSTHKFVDILSGPCAPGYYQRSETKEKGLLSTSKTIRTRTKTNRKSPEKGFFYRWKSSLSSGPKQRKQRKQTNKQTKKRIERIGRISRTITLLFFTRVTGKKGTSYLLHSLTNTNTK
jgi:hypothetical protein